MRRPVKIGVISLIAAVILIQFFRPERNLGEPGSESDMLIVTLPPDSLAVIFRTSCYDCHSDQTSYPWYGSVSPVSWILNRHIQSGKEQLNFSQFGNLEKNQKIGALADICDVLESGSMPLKGYLLVHREARISEQNLNALCSWTEAVALQLMRE